MQKLKIRLFHLWFLLARPMTLGVRGIVHDRGRNAVLLVRHTYVSGWHLPGGGVEVGEPMEEALTRELAEEGRVTLTGKPNLCSVHLNRQASRRDHVAVYLIENFTVDGTHPGDSEIAEARFFGLDDLPDALSEATRRRLAEAFSGAEISPYW
ncbi:NUDIX domain-containing protein [Nitratireductor basaltis]|uniref:DNA mismatch repair protein MutT n=1 Tax=Nitratireductor basaltis TaxID=472175 RepID=A0A084U920_9HYPH|nr:NUDIX domain-containing protein [Nitratireductor basaltis]KFB09456.1 DNA mismatch repair protein MutT [Nitratireductor basaltis]